MHGEKEECMEAVIKQCIYEQKIQKKWINVLLLNEEPTNIWLQEWKSAFGEAWNKTVFFIIDKK